MTVTEGVFDITDNDKSKLATIPAGHIEQPHQLIINNGERPTVTDNRKKQKKKAGVFGFFKAATFVLRHRSKGKQRTAEVAGAVSDWKKLVGSMRPLHLQENIQQSPRPIESLTPQTNFPSSPSSSSGTMSHYASANDLQALDVPSDQMHIAGTMSQYASANDLQALAASSSSDHMSQYSSANNLQELDEEEDPDRVFDAIGADDMIDVKAEEFIIYTCHEDSKEQPCGNLSYLLDLRLKDSRCMLWRMISRVWH